jgi:hypothetical protein
MLLLLEGEQTAATTTAAILQVAKLPKGNSAVAHTERAQVLTKAAGDMEQPSRAGADCCQNNCCTHGQAAPVEADNNHFDMELGA